LSGNLAFAVEEQTGILYENGTGLKDIMILALRIFECGIKNQHFDICCPLFRFPVISFRFLSGNREPETGNYNQ